MSTDWWAEEGLDAVAFTDDDHVLKIVGAFCDRIKERP
jgi:hypothetical protein